MRLIAETFDLSDVPDLSPRYNIAPTQSVVAIRSRDGVRSLSLLRWGLIPSWSDSPAIGGKMINARADTVATKPAFRSAFKTSRRLIVADGFYEWQPVGKAKQPYFVRLKDDRPFAFAGLAERWSKEGETIDSCTIITTEPNKLMGKFHDRMPVILRHEDYDAWLDQDCNDVAKLQPLLRQFPSDEMDAYPVSTIVNSPRNDVPECVKPLVE